MEEVFSGFLNPDEYTAGFTQLQHSFIESLYMIESLAELKVILYIMRHTWGFQEYDVWRHITTEEFMHGRNNLDNGTGLSKASVIAGLDKAIEHEFVLCKVNDRDLARIKKYYKLKLSDV